jgi:hypothetical protein
MRQLQFDRIGHRYILRYWERNPYNNSYSRYRHVYIGSHYYSNHDGHPSGNSNCHYHGHPYQHQYSRTSYRNHLSNPIR